MACVGHKLVRAFDVRTKASGYGQSHHTHFDLRALMQRGRIVIGYFTSKGELDKRYLTSES